MKKLIVAVGALAMFGLVTEVSPDGEDELAGTIETPPGIPAARPVTLPELIKQERVKAVITRMDGENIDSG